MVCQQTSRTALTLSLLALLCGSVWQAALSDPHRPQRLAYGRLA